MKTRFCDKELITASPLPSKQMCGNFGLLLLDLASAGRISKLLATMLRVTMARSRGYTPARHGRFTGRDTLSRR